MSGTKTFFNFAPRSSHGVWPCSLIAKGRADGIIRIGDTSWAGWGFQQKFGFLGYGLRKYSADEANAASQETLRDAPVFRNSPSKILDNEIRLETIGKKRQKHQRFKEGFLVLLLQ